MVPQTSSDVGQHRYHVNIAGTCCTAFSSMGKQQRWQHKSARPFYVWAISKHVMDEDFFFHENVPSFEVEVLQRNLPAWWVLRSWVTSPLEMGWPMRRPRQHHLLVAKSVMIPSG